MEQQWYIRNRGRVSGPFTVEQLKLMIARGQFRRFHEVSEDRKTWKAASAVDGIFSHSSNPAPTPVSVPADAPVLTPVEAEWFFIDRRGEQRGPLSPQQLLRMAKERAIEGVTLVWNAGMVDWAPLSSTELASRLPADALRKRSSPWWWLAPVLAVAGCLVVAALGTAVFLLRDRLRSPTVAPAKMVAGPITGLDRDEELAAAVGLVVCGFHITQPTGRHTDLPISTGTCFAVSADGYLFTNKHVIEEISNWRQANLLLEKLRKEELLEVRPTVWVFFKKTSDTPDKYVADIIHVSDHHDFGILKIDRSGPFFALSKAEQFRRGLKVVACGFPGNAKVPHSEEETMETIRRQKTEANVENQFKNRDFEFTMTSGTINRVVNEQEGRQWIEHSALLNPGNSGGPLVAEDGKVVGINTLLAKGEGGAIFSALGLHQLQGEINPRVSGVLWK
jgi:hypothetical protein